MEKERTEMRDCPKCGEYLVKGEIEPASDWSFIRTFMRCKSCDFEGEAYYSFNEIEEVEG